MPKFFYPNQCFKCNYFMAALRCCAHCDRSIMIIISWQGFGKTQLKTMKNEEAVAYFSITQSNKSGIRTRPWALLALAADLIRSRRIYWKPIAELSSLSNQDLTGMGINRSMIKGIAQNYQNIVLAHLTVWFLKAAAQWPANGFFYL